MTYKGYGRPSPMELKTNIERALDKDKAQDIVSVNLDGYSALADYMIIATGTSSRHVSALASRLRERLEIMGIRNIRIEGLAQADWVVLDAGDVIVHIFRPEVRQFYNIEKMWSTHPPYHIVGDVAGEQARA